jgi:hypothetical protein
VIIGQDNANVPNVIKLFADAFAKSSIEVNSVVGQRMVLILRHVQVSVDTEHVSRPSIDSFFSFADDSGDLSDLHEHSH